MRCNYGAELICNIMRISKQVIDQTAWNATLAMKELTEARTDINNLF